MDARRRIRRRVHRHAGGPRDFHRPCPHRCGRTQRQLSTRAPVSSCPRWRGAPSVRYPTPLLDCLAAWRRLMNELELLGAASDRVFVGGASAGGNLAVMSSLQQPTLVFQHRQASYWRTRCSMPHGRRSRARFGEIGADD